MFVFPFEKQILVLNLSSHLAFFIEWFLVRERSHWVHFTSLETNLKSIHLFLFTLHYYKWNMNRKSNTTTYIMPYNYWNYNFSVKNQLKVNYWKKSNFVVIKIRINKNKEMVHWQCLLSISSHFLDLQKG